jgi:hypothetical protein
VRQGRRPASRGVARRNAKLKALRELVGKDRAIVAVDLASQRQAAIVCDHDSVVLARRMFTESAWCVSEILAWAEPVRARRGRRSGGSVRQRVPLPFRVGRLLRASFDVGGVITGLLGKRRVPREQARDDEIAFTQVVGDLEFQVHNPASVPVNTRVL